ncbi:hypothetical protein TGARI_277055 [Toxoplasma gondii ARI]|uniref:Uncharacterized protein n=1 Tax=Toxoplasma gondii ARI TaxID=1074872 RepID=A0A139XP60_TOXGO|nr:hypothetical protein TGARI_277055 [Toxoplasma gondii ARI]
MELTHTELRRCKPGCESAKRSGSSPGQTRHRDTETTATLGEISRVCTLKRQRMERNGGGRTDEKVLFSEASNAEGKRVYTGQRVTIWARGRPSRELSVYANQGADGRGSSGKKSKATSLLESPVFVYYNSSLQIYINLFIHPPLRISMHICIQHLPGLYRWV